jgi:hypothetical protein
MNKKCVVARNINGIALNSFEYLLDDDGEIKVFDDIGQALSFLTKFCKKSPILYRWGMNCEHRFGTIWI